MKAESAIQNDDLRPYLNDVRDWHGYVRFLGLPTLQDNPDTPINKLFVSPLLAAGLVSPDLDPKLWPVGEDVASLLLSKKRVVALGDPGGGKTTLLNYISWLLSSGAVTAIPDWMKASIPIPIILRELDLQEVDSFKDVLTAFLKRPVAKSLQGKEQILFDYLQSGRAFVLVDGFDEVPLSLQKKVRLALWDGFESYPDAHFLITSRIIGYHDCALHRQTITISDVELESTKEGYDSREYIPIRKAHLAYIMPFDDSRILQFAKNWFLLRTFRDGAIRDANEFIVAVHANPTTQRLARTPQLLTLMALVFRVQAQLPDGRALLYDLISEAYLESIDRSRKLMKDPYPWKEKRRWLARVAFEMQVLRTVGTPKNDESADKELLVTLEQVLSWIQEAMEHSGYPKDKSFATEYLNWIGRRSGLLLPRGEGLFAFLHLSFQEYFASLYLIELLKDPDWVIAQRDEEVYEEGDDRVCIEKLQEWAHDARWQETLVFCFEAFAHLPKEARRLSEWLFGRDFGALALPDDDEDLFGYELLTRVIVDPHSGLPPKDKTQGFMKLIESFVRPYGRESYKLIENKCLNELLKNEAWSGLVLEEIEAKNIISAEVSTNFGRLIPCFKNKPEFVKLCINGKAESPLYEIQELENLTDLELHEMDLGNLNQLVGLEKLKECTFIGCKGTDLFPLRHLPSLEYLFVGACDLTTLEGLSASGNLHDFALYISQIEDLSPLSSLRLKSLLIGTSPVSDLRPLANQKKLRTLEISDTKVEDLSPLGLLKDLRSLVLKRNHILNYEVLAKCKNLMSLTLEGSDIGDLSCLSKITSLKHLSLKNSRFSRIEGIATLTALQSINVSGTRFDKKYVLRHLPKVKHVIVG